MSEKKKLFAVSVKKAGGREDVLTGPETGAVGRLLSIVKGVEIDLSMVSPGLCLKKSGLGERYTLNIPQGLSGVITVGKDSLPVEGLVALGLLKKKGKQGYILSLPQAKELRLSLGQCDLSFGYREFEAAVRAPVYVAAAIDKSIKRPLISKEDYNFVFFLAAFFVLQFSSAVYLRTIEIKKKDAVEALKQMTPRFAKLILQPPKEKQVKVEQKVKEEEEKPKEEVEAKQGEEAKPEEAPKQAEQTPQQAARRDAVRAKVRSKGLLSVIGAKSMSMDFGPIEIPSGAPSRFAGAGISTGTGAVSDEMFSRFKSEEADALEAASSRAASLGRQKDSSVMAEEALKEKKGRETLKDNIDKKGRKLASARVRAEEEVYRTIRSYMGGLKYIYNNALRTNQSLKGKISVKITIAASGRVTAAEMVSSTLDSQELRDALVDRINKWKFTELRDVEEFTITYTFDFAPVS